MDRQNPRTNGKSKAIQTKSHTGRLKNEKRIRAAEEGENSQGKKEVR